MFDGCSGRLDPKASAPSRRGHCLSPTGSGGTARTASRSNDDRARLEPYLKALHERPGAGERRTTAKRSSTRRPRASFPFGKAGFSITFPVRVALFSASCWRSSRSFGIVDIVDFRAPPTRPFVFNAFTTSSSSLLPSRAQRSSRRPQRKPQPRGSPNNRRRIPLSRRGKQPSPPRTARLPHSYQLSLVILMTYATANGG